MNWVLNRFGIIWILIDHYSLFQLIGHLPVENKRYIWSCNVKLNNINSTNYSSLIIYMTNLADSCFKCIELIPFIYEYIF